MEDIDIGDDSHPHVLEKQPLTSTPQSQSQSPSPYHPSYSPLHQHEQWRPTTPTLGSPLFGSPRSTPPTRRNTGEFSRQWKASPTSGRERGLGSRGQVAFPPSPPSQRTSSETMRPPPSRRSSISSVRSAAQAEAALPKKYISPEMNKVLHRHRLSDSGIVIGRGSAFGENTRGRRTGRFWHWGNSIASTSILRWLPEIVWILLSASCFIGMYLVFLICLLRLSRYLPQ